jgi:hypothetical protein
MIDLQTVTEPLIEPVTAEEATDFAKIDIPELQPRIPGLIKTARVALEKRLGLSFITRTFELNISRVPNGVIPLYRGPIAEILTISRYGATDWDPLELTDYKLIGDKLHAVIDDDIYGPFSNFALNFGRQELPYWMLRPQPMRITYKAGFGLTMEDVPDEFKTLILMTFAHLVATPTGNISMGRSSNLLLGTAYGLLPANVELVCRTIDVSRITRKVAS